MTGELEHVLAELASELGTTTGELWSYLSDGGIQAYARATAAVYGVGVLLCVVALAACAWMTKKALFLFRRDEGNDEDVAIALFIIDRVLAVGAIIPLIIMLPELCGWLASPEGMVMRTLVDRLG